MRAQQKVTLAFGLAVAAWTPLASFLALHGTGLWDAYAWPAKAWAWWLWLPYASSNHAVHEWLNRSAIGATGALMVVPFFALLNAKGGMGPARRPKPVRRGRSDNHGHSDWMPMHDLRRLFPGPDPVHGGIVVGEASRVDRDAVAFMQFDPRDKRTWGQGGKASLLIDPCDNGPTHSLIFAGSGGFKSVCAVSTLLHWIGSAVVLDPSCEMGPMLREAREAIGHRVIELAPASAAAVGVNVLDWIDPADSLAEAHVQSVVQWVCEKTGRGHADATAEFFASWGRKLVACLLADMLFDPALAPDGKSLRALRDVVATPERQMRSLLQIIHRNSQSRMARAVAGSLMDMEAGETFSGIYANANERTFWLSTRAYADLVSGRTFRTADLAVGGMTVFLQLPLETLITTPELARVIVGALLNTMYRRNGKPTGRVLFVLDEAALLGRMGILKQARDTGRKHGITLQLLLQSVGQLDDVWGRDERRSWYDGVSWRGYAAIRDLDTARELSELFGHHAVIAKSERSSGRAGSSEHEIKRRLIYPEELLQDTRPDELFIYAGGKPPIRCGRALFFRRDEMIGLVGADRFAPRENQDA
jgi:type IV secretion system protein VirD4